MLHTTANKGVARILHWAKTEEPKFKSGVGFLGGANAAAAIPLPTS